MTILSFSNKDVFSFYLGGVIVLIWGILTEKSSAILLRALGVGLLILSLWGFIFYPQFGRVNYINAILALLLSFYFYTEKR